MSISIFKTFDRLVLWGRSLGERSASTKLALLLTIAAICSCIATYAALNAAAPFGDNSSTVIWLLNLDLVILLLLVALIARRILKIWSSRKQGLAGSHLHVRLVLIFSILTATPAVLMAIFSAFFFHFGIQTWFSDRVQTAVLNAQAVAESYLEESQQSIRGDSLLLSQDIIRNATYLIDDRDLFMDFLEKQSILRNFSEVVVFDSTRRIIGSAGFTFTLTFENVIENLPESTLDLARDGEVVIMTGASEDRVRAILRLPNFQETYIFVGRIIDPSVLANLENTRYATQDYAALQGQYAGLQITVTMIFVMVALMLLLAAIWFGIVLARQMIQPISTLMSASDRVRAGDLNARVPETDQIEEFAYLGQSFNRMTSQIQEQRDALMKANRQLDERRRFTETVLSGVSSGIVSVNEQNIITIANSSAELLLNEDKDVVLEGRDLTEILPDIHDLLDKAYQNPTKITFREMPFVSEVGTKRTLLIRIAIERVGDLDKGAVVTFDDITELQAAQRKAAWADVARRIAHEIKNPLTPIQLSAERLKRKYSDEIKSDPKTFIQCTDTIVRHVEDIGRMVNEFSAFARMPEPVMQDVKIKRLVLETISLQIQAFPKIAFSYDGLDPDGPQIVASCDSQQLRQALTNLILNAVESHQSQQTDKKDKQIHISLKKRVRNKEMFCILSVIDNGPGFPVDEDLKSLAEPYITHKEKGTGLGLAIVQKIMEDHKGRLLLGNSDPILKPLHLKDLKGASVSLCFPCYTNDSAAATETHNHKAA